MNGPWKYITIHCAASKPGQDLSASDIDRMHKAKGWVGIGYHFVIRLDGTIEFGRALDKTGAHVYGFNKDNVGICYVGGLNDNGDPKDTRTIQQKKAMELLLMTLKSTANGKNSFIRGHRDFSPDKDGDGIIEPFEWLKACPCFDVKTEFGWM